MPQGPPLPASYCGLGHPAVRTTLHYCSVIRLYTVAPGNRDHSGQSASTTTLHSTLSPYLGTSPKLQVALATLGSLPSGLVNIEHQQQHQHQRQSQHDHQLTQAMITQHNTTLTPSRCIAVDTSSTSLSPTNPIRFDSTLCPTSPRRRRVAGNDEIWSAQRVSDLRSH